MGKLISVIVDIATLSVYECNDGFWLYDKTRSMNLSMRANTAQQAFIEALGYYQARLTRVEQEYSSLQQKVNAFVSQFAEDD